LPRELEITFVQPAKLGGAIKIGDVVYTVESEREKLDEELRGPICAAGTAFYPGPYFPRGLGISYIVIDSSANGVAPKKAKALLEDCGHIDFLVSVNAETKTTIICSESIHSTPANLVVYDPSWDVEKFLLPNRFGLDATRAVRSVEYLFRKSLSYYYTPCYVIFIGDQWEELLPKISPKDFGVLYGCVIMTSEGKRINYVFNNSAIERVYPENYASTHPDHLFWSQGAQLWKLQQDHYDRGTLNANYKKILAESSRTGVLVPQTAYIVVETEAQRKMLAVKQLEAANANTALDFDYDADQVDAPTLLVLLAGLAVVFFIRKFRHG